MCLGFPCPVYVPKYKKDVDKLDRAQKAPQVIARGGEEGRGEPCAFVRRGRRRVSRACLVNVFWYLTGGFKDSRARLFSDTHNKRIRENRQITRREILIKC